MIADDKIKVIETYNPHDALRRILNANPSIQRRAYHERRILGTIKMLAALSDNLGWTIVIEQGDFTAVPFAKVTFKDKEGCAFTTCWLPVKEAIKPILYRLFYSGGRVIDLEYVEELVKQAVDSIFKSGPYAPASMFAAEVADERERDRFTARLAEMLDIPKLSPDAHTALTNYISKGASA